MFLVQEMMIEAEVAMVVDRVVDVDVSQVVNGNKEYEVVRRVSVVANKEELQVISCHKNLLEMDVVVVPVVEPVGKI